MTIVGEHIEPGETGIDPAALERLRARIVAEVEAGRMPAAQLAIGLDDRLVATENFGAATDSTRFNIFSCTKAFIAGVVWQLLGEGKLSTDTRAIDLIPGFGTEGRTPEWMARVTLEQLLTHTSGFPNAPLGPPRWETRDERLAVFARWHAQFEPGTHYEYHPTAAHWVVAEMIEAVEGVDFRAVVRRRIFEPLHLAGAGLGVPADDQQDIAELTIVGDAATDDDLIAVFGTADIDMGEVVPELLQGFNAPSVREVGVPGGGGVSTAAALALYYQALLHNTGGLWDPEVLEDGTGRIRCTMPDPVTGVPANRSLGLVVSSDDGFSNRRGIGPTVSAAAFGHNGAGGQIAWGDPSTGVSFAFVTSGLDRNFVREARRTLSITSKGGLCLPFSA